jgi:hypothetical protein
MTVLSDFKLGFKELPPEAGKLIRVYIEIDTKLAGFILRIAVAKWNGPRFPAPPVDGEPSNLDSRGDRK